MIAGLSVNKNSASISWKRSASTPGRLAPSGGTVFEKLSRGGEAIERHAERPRCVREGR